MEEEGDKRKGEKGKENVGTKEKEEEKAAGKRTRFKHRNILNIIRCKLIRLIFFRFLLVKRLAITVKVSTFALAFGKQGLVRPRGTGAEERRVH